MTVAYARRKINVTFQLGTGSFGASGFDQLKLEGLRVAAQIEQPTLPAPSGAVIRVYGMTKSHLNEITKASLNWETRSNAILVEAGDDQSGMSVVFNGNFFKAAPDFRDLPNSPLVVVANAGQGIQIKPVAPISFPGSVSAATALGQIAQQFGFTVENNGVNTVLASPYFDGTAYAQMMLCIEAANCFGVHDTISKVVRIWPKNVALSSTGTAPVISAATGLVGYPEFDYNTLRLRSLFNPSLRAVGKNVEVQSDFPAANGKWTVTKIDYDLTSEMPNGPWHMEIETYRIAGGGS